MDFHSPTMKEAAWRWPVRCGVYLPVDPLRHHAACFQEPWHYGSDFELGMHKGLKRSAVLGAFQNLVVTHTLPSHQHHQTRHLPIQQRSYIIKSTLQYQHGMDAQMTGVEGQQDARCVRYVMICRVFPYAVFYDH